jgi:hypothetical protein
MPFLSYYKTKEYITALCLVINSWLFDFEFVTYKPACPLPGVRADSTVAPLTGARSLSICFISIPALGVEFAENPG